MNNLDLANTFTQIADLLEIKGEVIYKTLAYRKAAESLQNLGQDIHEIWKADQLTQIPGVGKTIAEKIDELLRTGHLEFLDRLGSEVPLTLTSLLQVQDVGPKKVALFWREAQITTLDELEAAASAGKLRHLSGMGEKSEQRILEGIQALKRRGDRTPLGTAWPRAQELLAWLRQLPGVQAAEGAGSLRRMRQTVGDLDLLAASNDSEPVMEAFVHHPDVERVLAQGKTKSSVAFRFGLKAQLWVHPLEHFGTALQYATGSKDHNVRLRELAQKQGLSLSEHALLREADGHEIFCAREEEVYAALGLPWIPPELREDRGEIQAALEHRLPHLIESGDLRAELHCHSTWSDGKNSLLEMAQAAIQAGLKVLAVTDHSASLGVAGGMKLEDIMERMKEVRQVQAQIGDQLVLLQGAEVEILADGSLDYPDEVLAQLDVVVASLHSSLRQPREQVTARLIRAIQNPHVDIIGHPTGRLIPNREGADLDMDAVLKAAQESGLALEINANPERLDLDEIYSRRAIEMGIPLSINTDAHHAADIGKTLFGIATARRAWVEDQHVINAWEPSKLLAWLKDHPGTRQ